MRSVFVPSLFTVTLLACGGGGSPPLEIVSPDGGTTNRIAVENARPGDPGWTIDDLGPDDRFAAYARPLSLAAGDQLDVAVDVSAPRPVSWAIYRLGHYGGVGARLVDAGGPIPVQPQDPPVLDPTTGLVECRWRSNLSVKV